MAGAGAGDLARRIPYTVGYPRAEARGLCLASTATQYPEGTALASSTDTSGLSDHQPVLTQHAKRGALLRPSTFDAGTDCFPATPRTLRWEGARGRTVSLPRTRVPKPMDSLAHNERAALTQALQGGASAPQAVRHRP